MTDVKSMGQDELCEFAENLVKDKRLLEAKLRDTEQRRVDASTKYHDEADKRSNIHARLDSSYQSNTALRERLISRSLCLGFSIGMALSLGAVLCGVLFR